MALPVTRSAEERSIFGPSRSYRLVDMDPDVFSVVHLIRKCSKADQDAVFAGLLREMRAAEPAPAVLAALRREAAQRAAADARCNELRAAVSAAIQAHKRALVVADPAAAKPADLSAVRALLESGVDPNHMQQVGVLLTPKLWCALCCSRAVRVSSPIPVPCWCGPLRRI